MHTVDLIVVCVAVVVIVAFAAILARQRQMLHAPGAVPIAVQRGSRWLYGIGRYEDGELRWYRALGVATRPTLVLRRSEVEVTGRRDRLESERGALPGTVVVVHVSTETAGPAGAVSLAIGDSAYTGFVSWLESSAPR